ncbi:MULTISPECIES: hypothetical protein [Mycobacteriaceae]|uniref:Uncharacterized protein n=1 Tax=Mycolicibacterium parafortuitum TaxID=39692 RepID=A0ACC6ME64_MYCPF|nr:MULTISPECIES: hypothetical protein [Mycobacteriaceae]MDZ5085256.1 hypothetical protein [Mycolicibacterium parafortuitum]
MKLGLPGAGDSRIAVSGDPFGPRPFGGSVENRAYFLAHSTSGDQVQWWLVGLDASTGGALFDAVPFSEDERPPQCFLNGPTDVLCLGRSPVPSAAVIDAQSGVMKYRGPTDLRALDGGQSVKQVGIYAVAIDQDQGVFGIGPRAETTWFVPGNGSIRVSQAMRSRDSWQTLTAQLEANPRTYRSTVFSVADGKVIEPEIGEGYTLGKVAFYTGGFAAEVNEPNGVSAELAFFDESGKRLSGNDSYSAPDDGSIDLPVVSSERDDETVVFSADGRKLLEARSGAVALVGTTLMVNMTDSQEFPEWQQYSMRDGAAGPVCNFPMDDYVGHHDSTLVFEFSYVQGEVLLAARDLNSCDRLWTIPKEVDSLDRIWRIDGTLVQLTNEGTELRSLVAPD